MNTTSKNKAFVGLKMILSVSLIFFMFGCGEKYCDNVLDLDEVEDVDLSPLTSDVDIIPIKCSVPMDGIRAVHIFEDYIFLFGLKRKEIYCVKNDSVISILKAIGRGHGEYTYIDDFAYDEKTKILYVVNDEKLLKYSVPSMTFLESMDINYSTIGMMVLNPDEILANCSLWEDDTYKEFYNGLCVVSTATGKIIKRCFETGFYDGLCINEDDFVRYDGGIMMSLAGIYNNKVISLDINTGNIKDLDYFCFSPKWRLPKNLIKLANKWDSFNYSIEADKRTVYCDGFHMPAFINSRLTFWCFPEENGSDKNIVVIKDKEKYIKRQFYVSGTSLSINAYTVKDNRFITVFCTAPETTITDPENVSDFGKEIYNAMKAQPFNNPILLSFTVDKNI
jgi:hypothetical protein